MTRALGGSNLIPRVINTNILVCTIIGTDCDMGSMGHRPNYFQHGTGTNGVSYIYDLELHEAASCGNVKRAREAVARNKGLLSHKDSQGNIPLHRAMENGHKETALFLVQVHPLGSYALNNSNISPLYLAAYRKDLELVKAMFCELNKDDKVLDNLKKGKSVVDVAITYKNQDLLQLILKSQRELIKCPNEDGLTPLSYAAFNGNLDIVRYLLKKFPNSISYRNNDNSNPFHKAGLGGYVEVLKELYSNSKTREFLLAGDHHGRTVLHLAAKERGNKLRHVVSYLLSLKEGKDLIKKKDENQLTPLELAKKNSNHEVEELIKEIKLQ
ncbi:alpha-latrocrustotoxin-Lt1a-like [Chenopodium quinoa]|uniref:Uncharacterized protein n=1 Tax=Chenopodium quinoa TaxID=63459 RepID=A0A803L823_CHEQI|nr:alpha-latrocrustotoxin-Lt1a-like [Chenopodium quinoa]